MAPSTLNPLAPEDTAVSSESERRAYIAGDEVLSKRFQGLDQKALDYLFDCDDKEFIQFTNRWKRSASPRTDMPSPTQNYENEQLEMYRGELHR